MKNTKILLLSVALATLTATSAFAKESRGERGKPPAVAIEACSSAAEESACEFVGRGNKALTGVCRTVRSGELACVPAGHRRGGERGERGERGEERDDSV